MYQHTGYGSIQDIFLHIQVIFLQRPRRGAGRPLLLQRCRRLVWGVEPRVKVEDLHHTGDGSAISHASGDTTPCRMTRGYPV